MDTDIYRGLSEMQIAREQGKKAQLSHTQRLVAFPIETLQELEAQSIKDGTDYHIVLNGVIAQLKIITKISQ
jgi:hypothetical protein